MTNIFKNILLITVMLMAIRCEDKPDHIQTGMFIFPKVPNSQKNTINNYYDPLLFGKKTVITHSSYGCFHHTSVSMEIEENEGQYLMTIKREGSDKQLQPSEPLRLDSTFRYAMLDFNRFYTQVIAKPKNSTMKEEYVFETIDKLTIQGGFRKIEFLIESAKDLSGYYELLSSIDHHLIR